jgi:hypothetical protein
MAPIGSTPRYRRGERYVDGIGRVRRQFNGGKVIRVGGIR